MPEHSVLMPRTDRTRRLAALLRVLNGGSKGCTITQVVQATGTSKATAYRDLELLRQSGYTLQIKTVNGEARYTAIASELTSQPMSARERAALLLARRALSSVEGTWLVQELDALLRQGRSVGETQSGVLFKLGLLSYDPKILQTLHDAVTQQRVLRIRYRGAEDASARSRIVHPVRLQVADQQPYLLAWDESKRALRVFKAARVRQATKLRSKSRMPASALEAMDQAHSVKIWQNEPCEVRIRIAPAAARFVHEWPLVPGQVLESGSDGSVVVCATVYGLPETLRWTLRWGRNAEVLSPSTLRESVQRELSEALAAYKPRGASRPKARMSP